MDRIDINLTLCKGSCDINEKPGTVITEYFDIGDIPTDYCDQHFYGDDESGMQEYTTEEEIYNPEPTPDPNNPNGDNTGDNTGDNAGDNTGDTGGGDAGGGDTGGGDTGGDTGGGDSGYTEE